MNAQKIFAQAREAGTRLFQLVIEKVEEEPNFTGKIVFEVHFNNGGICNSEAYTMRKIKNKEKSK